MATYWCHNAKTGEIFSYRESDGLTDFPRGTLLAYGDYLTTGLKSEEAAKTWSTEWHACSRCRTARYGVAGTPCSVCGTPLGQ